MLNWKVIKSWSPTAPSPGIIHVSYNIVQTLLKLCQADAMNTFLGNPDALWVKNLLPNIQPTPHLKQLQGIPSGPFTGCHSRDHCLLLLFPSQ